MAPVPWLEDASFPSTASGQDQDRPFFLEPALRVRPDFAGALSRQLARRKNSEGAVVREVQIVEGGPRIACVLDHEVGHLTGPEASRLGSPGRGPAVALQRGQDCGSGETLFPVAAPEPSLVFPAHRVPLDHEIAGAGAVDQSRNRLRIGVMLLQRPLLPRIE